jgi:hypothetical protein
MTPEKPVDQKIASVDDFRNEFHRLLGRLVHAHGLFDFNIGLQLNWMGPFYGDDVGEFLDPHKAPFSKRLKKLKQLVMHAFEPAGKTALEEFVDWFKQASEATALRNDYVHGRWGVPGKYKHKPPGRMIDAEPLLTFIPMHWDISPDRSDDSIALTLAEFAEQVNTVEHTFSEYWRIYDRYECFAKPGRKS